MNVFRELKEMWHPISRFLLFHFPDRRVLSTARISGKSYASAKFQLSEKNLY